MSFVLTRPIIFLCVGVIAYSLSFFQIYVKARTENNKTLIFLSLYFLLLCFSPILVILSNILNLISVISIQILIVFLGNIFICVSDLFQNLTVDYLMSRRVNRITLILLFAFGFAFGMLISGSVPLKLYTQPDIFVYGYDFQSRVGFILFLVLFSIKLIGQLRFLVYSIKIEKKEEQTAKEKIKGGARFSRWFILAFVFYLFLFSFRIQELISYGLDYLVSGLFYLFIFQVFLKRSNLYDRPPAILNQVLFSYKSGPILKMIIQGSKIEITEDPEQMVADRLVLLASDLFKNYEKSFSIFGIETRSGYVMQYLIGNWSVVFFLSRFDEFYEEKIKDLGNSVENILQSSITANKGILITNEFQKKILIQMALIV